MDGGYEKVLKPVIGNGKGIANCIRSIGKWEGNKDEKSESL
jgi:hypothetical protein